MKKEPASFSDLFDQRKKGTNFADLVESTLTDNQIETVLAERSAASRPSGGKDDSTTAKRHALPREQLDLHGMTEEEALRKTTCFLQNSRHQGMRQVLVITGKGLHSEGEPVLPDAIENALYFMKQRGEIHSYNWDKGERSRSGALVVTLGP